MAARGIFGLLSLILIAGGMLLSLFILIAGAVDGSPVNKWYFLEADTSNIPGAPSLSRWTFWNIVDGATGSNDKVGASYSNVKPARPLDPPRNFGTTTNVPEEFINTRYYYYMTRFMFAFTLIALFWALCSLVLGVLALCTRIGAYLSSVLALLAAVFQALTAALMTTAYVKGRNNFNRNGQNATLGKTAFGFEWAALACWFLATVFFCIGGAASKDSTTTKSKGGFFGRRSRSTRSRGSFVNGDKDYA